MVCANLQLRQPVTLYSDNLADIDDVFAALLQAAKRPEKSLAVPMTASLKVSCKAHLVTPFAEFLKR